MNESQSREGWLTAVAPSVSTEAWCQHVLKKLRKGYVLIVSADRPTANFFKVGSGYESCSYRAACRAIAEGWVVPMADHALGRMYALTADAALAPPEAPGTRPPGDAPEPPDPVQAELEMLERSAVA